jgi:hypothetical protein
MRTRKWINSLDSIISNKSSACNSSFSSLNLEIIDIERLYKIEGNHCKDISCQYLHAFYWSTLVSVLAEVLIGRK